MGKIRVFISSTTKDLLNERDAVVRKIREIDFEPVNAESWLPNGNKSWLRIQEEIDSSHMFVLILGERYGWIPQTGDGATEGRSVTHMELIRARERGLPILPFIKKLSFDSDRDSDEAKRREALRREIADWASGHFITEFDLYHDLAIKVGASVVGVLADKYLSSEVQRRAIITRSREDRLQLTNPSVPVRIPPELIARVISQEITLIAGPGVSLAAGYPSERALSEYLASLLTGLDELSDRPIGAIPLPLMAQLFEQYHDHWTLLDTLEEFITRWQMGKPTQVHLQGVKLFRRILTTNFDKLFETAYRQQGIDFELLENPSNHKNLGNHYERYTDSISHNLLFKLHGTITNPESLLITARDMWKAYDRNKPLERSLREALGKSSVLIIGWTLSNIYEDWIGNHLSHQNRHYLIVPPGKHLGRYRYGRMFDVIEADQNDFISNLASAVEHARNERS